MPRKLFIGASVLAVLTCAAVWIVQCIRAERSRLETLAEWRTAPRQEWPETFLEILRQAERKHVHLGEVTVLHRPYFGEYLLRCGSSAELFDLMVARWKLSPVNQQHKLVRLVLERMPSDFPLSVQADDVAYYISASWLAGDKGHWYCVLNDKAQKHVVVRYSYNF
jgi:hypothetical protein